MHQTLAAVHETHNRMCVSCTGYLRKMSKSPSELLYEEKWDRCIEHMITRGFAGTAVGLASVLLLRK
jgi:hypothetical protein